MAAAAPPVPYVHVLLLGANNIVPDGITEDDSLEQILHWIGFVGAAQKNALIDDAFGSFDDLKVLTEKDVSTMATSFAGRPAASRIFFGTRKTKSIKAIVHWVQDFYRVSMVPSIVGLDEVMFKAQLERALNRATVRTNMKAQTATQASAASPGPLKQEKQWKEWEEKFVNYARSHIGVNGIPLSYVIRENDAPDIGGTFTDFVNETIACAPLNGEYYNADRLSVFNMIVSFTTGQPSGDWIKNTIRSANGRRSMKALQDHFSGEGNATRNIAEADRLKESLHYKSERSMPFETFLTNCQRMYNIYEKEQEKMEDDAKLRFLFKSVSQCSGLTGTVDALKAQIVAGTNVTYTMAANHLTTAVSQFPDYISKHRHVSAISRNEGGGGSSSIIKSDGSINTGYIPNWRALTQEDRDTVMAERAKLGISGNGKGKGKGKTGNPGSAEANRLKQLTKQNKVYKRQIKSLNKKVTFDDDDSDEESKDDEVDAGDQFGGKASKKRKKKK
jgi:hypothetical protein